MNFYEYEKKCLLSRAMRFNLAVIIKKTELQFFIKNVSKQLMDV